MFIKKNIQFFKRGRIGQGYLIVIVPLQIVDDNVSTKVHVSILIKGPKLF